jgi:TPR repeat protein
MSLTLLTYIGCASVTPGDAARSAGQYQSAARLYEIGAKQGDPAAAYKLAQLYNVRPGLPKDLPKAIYWYTESARLGEEQHQYTFLQTYDIGNAYNELKEFQKAKLWYEKGAQEGHHYSIYCLAGLYADDKIQPKDDITGLMWLDIVTMMAASFDTPNEGHKYILADPEGYRKKFINRMSQDEMVTAKSRAQQWLAEKAKEHARWSK